MLNHISNVMDGAQDDTIFGEDVDDDDKLVTDDIHPDVPIKESNFKEQLEHSDNDLDRNDN